MSIKRVKQIQKENDKKRRLGLVGPDVSDETMLSALRKAKKSLQVEQTASKARRPRLRRSKLLLFAMVCLMAFIPVGTWGYRSFVEPAPSSSASGQSHFDLRRDEFVTRTFVADDSSLICSIQYQSFIITMIEKHNQMGTQFLFTDQESTPSAHSVPFYGQTMQYYVDHDGVIGHVEFPSLHCLLRISMPNASESEFLYVVSHIQKLE